MDPKPWRRHRLVCALRSFASDATVALLPIEPFGYDCVCGCDEQRASVVKQVRDDLYDSYNEWVRKWYDKSVVFRVYRDTWYGILAALDMMLATMLGEPGSGACGHLHRMADGYCPSCLRWIKERTV